TGPAVRRYASRPRCVVAKAERPEPGLRALPPAEEILADARGINCPAPLSVVMDIDLGLLFPSEAGRRHPFIGSFCADCEADEDIREWRGWSAVDGKLVFDEERDEVCSAEEVGEPTRMESLGLAPSLRY